MKQQLIVWASVALLLIGAVGSTWVATTVGAQVSADVELVSIKAPIEAHVGQLVVLDVSDSDAESFTWVVEPATPNFLVIDGGRRAVFSSESAGDFLFVVAGAKDGQVAVKTHRIKVGGGGPVPPPKPTNDLVKRIADWCKPIESPTKRDEAIKLSQSFSSVAAVISAGIITTPAEIVDATKKSNRDALGDGLDMWRPFLEGLQVELKSRADAGELTDADSHARVWREVADALAKYAETL